MIFGLILSTIYTKIRIPRITMNSQNVIRDYRLSLITFIKNALVVAYKGNNKLPNSEQSYKGKVKTHKYINRQNQSTTGKL